MAPVSVVMVGIGGYGAEYVAALDRLPLEKIRLTGAVDPFPTRSCAELGLSERQVPVFPSLEALFQAGCKADLVVIASPIHHHISQSMLALNHGCDVLCDKPLGATIQEASALICAREASGHSVRIGYQWSYSEGIRSLKRDIQAGRFGGPVRMKSVCLWPRTLAYYRRNDWAGRLRDETTGRWILDSPLNNALAHFLHNLFFLLGPAVGLSARPIEVTAEVCRVNSIESFDTVACRARVDGGVEVLFYGSHATQDSYGPQFELEFEEASVAYKASVGHVKDEMSIEVDGRRVGSYPSPNAGDHFAKLTEAVRAVTGKEPVECGPEAAAAQTLCMNGVHESISEIPTVSSTLRRRSVQPDRYWIDGLDGDLRRCYERGVLPSEAGVSWATKGRTIDLVKYDHFPSSENHA